MDNNTQTTDSKSATTATQQIVSAPQIGQSSTVDTDQSVSSLPASQPTPVVQPTENQMPNVVNQDSGPVSTTSAVDKTSGARPTQAPTSEPLSASSVSSDSQTTANETVAQPTQATAQPVVQPVVGVPTGKELEPRPMPDISKLSESEVQEEEKQVESAIENLVVQSPADKKPDIPEEAKTAGVTLAQEEMENPMLQKVAVTLPMSIDEAAKTKRKTRIRDSLKWLSALIVYHWKKMRAKPEEDDSSAFG